MIVFATSDKGGTGRSVTGTNVAYQAALSGLNVCYLDLDFGSPTAGAIFGVDTLSRGTTTKRGLHSYFQGHVTEPERVDLWTASDRNSVRERPPGSGRMVLVPGDAGGGEFVNAKAAPMLERFRRLIAWAEMDFDLTLVDLSAGRSFALQLALKATGGNDPVVPMARWLVFHRWTMQHVVAAYGLVHGDQGILDAGVKLGHDRERLLDQIRFVRTALLDPNAPELMGLRLSQLAWLQDRDHELHQKAKELKIGRTWVLDSVPLDPVLQWHEQLITKADLFGREVANEETAEAFRRLAVKLFAPEAWERQ